MYFTLFDISKEISTKSLNFEGKSYSLFHSLLKKSRFFLWFAVQTIEISKEISIL